MLTSSKQSGFGIISVIVIIAVVAVLGFVGWRVFMAQSSNSMGNNGASGTNTFKIPELGVGFEVKEGIEVLSSNSSTFSTPDGRKVEKMLFSTQALVDEGKREVGAGINPCAFDKTSQSTDSLADIVVYDSAADAAKEDVSGQTKVADINQTNGYLTVGNKVFLISNFPPKADGSSAPYQKFCTTTASGNQLEQQQWQLLHDSLLTLKAIN